MTAAIRSRSFARIFLATVFGIALFSAPASAQKQGGSITVGLELDIPGFDPLKVGVFDTSAETAAAAKATVTINKPITNGLTYNFTFTFEKAGQITLAVPISAGEAGRRDQAGNTPKEGGGDTGGHH